MVDGSEKLLFDKIPGSFIVAFRPDSYHFLVLDPVLGLFQSDLSGKPFEKVPDKVLTEEYYDKVYSHDSVNTYSPDQQYVAIWDWSRGTGAGQTIPLTLRNIATGHDVEIFRSGPGEQILGAWSPDGKEYAFTWYSNIGAYYSVIYIVDRDGSNLTAVTTPLAGVTLGRPRWSPDGRKIAVIDGGGGNRAWILDVTSKHLRQLAVSPVIDMDSQVLGGTLAWSPDNDWLAYPSLAPLRGIVLLNTQDGQSYCGRNELDRSIEMLDWH